MVGAEAGCDRGGAWPSRSRTQGAAFGGAKGKPEDAEMRSARRVIRACRASAPTISVASGGRRRDQPLQHVSRRSRVDRLGRLVDALAEDGGEAADVDRRGGVEQGEVAARAPRA